MELLLHFIAVLMVVEACFQDVGAFEVIQGCSNPRELLNDVVVH